MKKTLPVAVLLGYAQAGHDPSIECLENLQCEIDLGKGACCLSLSSATTSWQRCKEASFVNYYTKSSTYDAKTNIWTSPADSTVQLKVNCVGEMMPKVMPQKYPFVQPWIEGDIYYKNRRDAVYKGAQTTDFYWPKTIANNWDQVDHMLTMTLYGYLTWTFPLLFLPLYLFILINNYVVQIIDIFIWFGDPTSAFYGQSMYTQWLCNIIYNEAAADLLTWGPFKYYDICGGGLIMFVIDITLFRLVPFVYLYEWMTKAQTETWGPMSHEWLYDVYPNPYQPIYQWFGTFPAASMNRAAWASAGSYDCNGNYAEEGLYCFCQS